MTLRSVIGRLATFRSSGGRTWHSLRTTRQRIEAGVAFAAAVVCIVAAGLQVGPALAETTVEGEPVPDDVLPAIVVGATSCPALTGPRLAAQLMAASGFKPTAVSERGEGIAGLDSRAWQTWAPWQQAQRADVRANVLALAHRTCEAIGQVRASGADGDLWRAAVAAEKVGLDAVVKVKGVPTSAQEHVDTVAGYANWYARQPQFSGATKPARPSVTPAPDQVGIPEEYVDAVVKAGQVCPSTVSAARIAAQLRSLSAFNPNLKGSGGGQGIAQFTPSMWEEYKPSDSASVWDPQAAIPTLATAMCDLRNQLSGMNLRQSGEESDAYSLALAAYQWGVTAVRAKGGVPRAAAVPQLVDTVDVYLPAYSSDERLAHAFPSPSASSPAPPPSSSPSSSSPPPSSSPSATPKPSPTVPVDPPPTPAATPSPSPPPAPPATALPASWDPAVSYQFKNALTGRVMEVPGKDNVTASGTTIQLSDNLRQKDQYWHVAKAADPRYVVITNAFNNKALGIRGGSIKDAAELVQLDPAFDNPNQQWSLIDGGTWVTFINRNSGKALDILGDDCCGKHGTPVTQWSRQSYAVDQRWVLSR
ncbi:RICIN domain-containing protein [Micromonospora sp. NPDC085948]|uniref:RICIN domain-containing protein n=1 Tax=Micromonospora sp. NPDC085948 TaxID=3155293 RepID=UPI00342A5E90